MLIVGNWKAYITSTADIAGYVNLFSRAAAYSKNFGAVEVRTSSRIRGADEKKKMTGADVVLCPPFPFLSGVAAHAKPLGIHAGAQDVFWESKGPYTGEITPAMLKSMEVSYVIIGHSERRRNFGETDESVSKKVCAVLAEGLAPIVCVGEWEKPRGPEMERKMYDFVRAQVRTALRLVDAKNLKRVVFAYEPVWAITGSGTGEADTPENAARMIVFIRRIIASHADAKTAHAMRVIYGGSVTSQNCEGFLSHQAIDGVLAGSASTHPKEFAKIISIANAIKK